MAEGKIAVSFNKTSECYSLNNLARLMHANATTHGWWDDERGFPETIALIHSEASEALEEYRDGYAVDDVRYECKSGGTPSKCEIECAACSHGKPCGIPSELADIMIRVLDFCGHANIDIEAAIMEKHAYNIGRPYRHGGKKC